VEKPDIDENWIRSICGNILKDNNQPEAVVTIIFSNDSKLRKLKKEYFYKDVLTDTISFNLEDEGDHIEGEIYISLERVAENSQTYKQDFIMECKRVIIHSCLHLLGFDDQLPEEKKEMTRLEDYYISNNIIATPI
jgi:rRNA maturation RNase YbeY